MKLALLDLLDGEAEQLGRLARCLLELLHRVAQGGDLQRLERKRRELERHFVELLGADAHLLEVAWREAEVEQVDHARARRALALAHGALLGSYDLCRRDTGVREEKAGADREGEGCTEGAGGWASSFGRQHTCSEEAAEGQGQENRSGGRAGEVACSPA